MRWLMLALLALFCATPAHAGRSEIEDAVVHVPAGRTPDDVAAAVRAAFDRRNWTVVSQDSSHAVMSFEGSRYTVRVEVQYPGSDIVIRYLDSTKLDYLEQRGKRYVNSRYHRWINAIAEDLTNWLANGVPPEPAKIQGSHDLGSQASIMRIDDDQFMWTGYVPDHALRIAVGQHEIGLRYDEVEGMHSTWSYQVTFHLEAATAAHYTVRYKRVGNIVKFKIVDDASGASVGKANDPDELLE